MKVIFKFTRHASRRARLTLAMLVATALHVGLLRFSPSDASGFAPRPRVSLAIVVAKTVAPPPPAPVAHAKKPRALHPEVAPVAAPAPVPPDAAAPESAPREVSNDAVVTAPAPSGVAVAVSGNGVGEGTATPTPAVAPTPGPSAAKVRESIGHYSGWLRQKVDALKRYPLQARRMHVQGTTIVSVRVRRDGQLACAPQIVTSSHPILDQEALRMVSQAAPFQSLPEGSGDVVEFTIPIDFSLTS